MRDSNGASGTMAELTCPFGDNLQVACSVNIDPRSAPIDKTERHHMASWHSITYHVPCDVIYVEAMDPNWEKLLTLVHTGHRRRSPAGVALKP